MHDIEMSIFSSDWQVEIWLFMSSMPHYTNLSEKKLLVLYFHLLGFSAVKDTIPKQNKTGSYAKSSMKVVFPKMFSIQQQS